MLYGDLFFIFVVTGHETISREMLDLESPFTTFLIEINVGRIGGCSCTNELVGPCFQSLLGRLVNILLSKSGGDVKLGALGRFGGCIGVSVYFNSINIHRDSSL